jgi:2-polyprenyl-6-methoxyphenol hydroxylase-like FAD-dependent oxidoreductase
MWAYYRGVVGRAPGDSQIWRLGGEWARDTAIAVRTDDDLTMLVSFPTKDRLAEFGDDRVAALERTFAAVADPPDLSRAERVSKVIGMTDYPCLRRDPTPAPGLYLVGDAAVAGDPLPAVGCGWAFRAAEWLVEATVPELRGQASSGAARRSYRRSLRFLLRHDRLARRAALAGPPDPVQRAVLRAAALDPEIGRRSYLFAMRAAPVSTVINPVTIGRALAVSARSRPAVTAASSR